MKSNLTKEFYVLIRETKETDELTKFTENFINSHNCYELREYLIKYRTAIDAGTFTITPQERADLDRSIDSTECDLAKIEKKGGLQCCYDKDTHKDIILWPINYCNQAKNQMIKTFKDKIKTDRNTVLTQMCWFNKNYIKQEVTFCGDNSKTEVSTNQTKTDQPTTQNKPEVSTSQNKPEVSTNQNKPQPPKVSDSDLKGWDKYPCLKNYTIKKVSTENGDYTYKVKAYGDHTEYYYLDGTMKIKDADGTVTNKYFEC